MCQQREFKSSLKKKTFVKVQIFFTFQREMCAFAKQLNYAENVDTSNKNEKKGWNEFCFLFGGKKNLVEVENLDNESIGKSKNFANGFLGINCKNVKT